MVLWTDDSGDWRNVTVAALERHLLAHATAPEIVLLHSGKLATIEALPDWSIVSRRRAIDSLPWASCCTAFRPRSSTIR